MPAQIAEGIAKCDKHKEHGSFSDWWSGWCSITHTKDHAGEPGRCLSDVGSASAFRSWKMWHNQFISIEQYFHLAEYGYGKRRLLESDDSDYEEDPA